MTEERAARTRPCWTAAGVKGGSRGGRGGAPAGREACNLRAPEEDENDDNDHGHSALAQHMLDVFNYDDGARARGDLWRLDGG